MSQEQSDPNAKDTPKKASESPELDSQEQVEQQQETETVDLEALEAELEEAKKQAEANREQALRAVAEADNVRKRSQKQIDQAKKFALEKFATELLGVKDSLDMGQKASEQEDADVEKVAEGLQLTARMFQSTLEKFGIEEIDPVGQPFNPEFHEAVSMQESADFKPNTVSAVMQKGYTLNGRVLRAAMVIVTKAPGEK